MTKRPGDNDVLVGGVVDVAQGIDLLLCYYLSFEPNNISRHLSFEPNDISRPLSLFLLLWQQRVDERRSDNCDPLICPCATLLGGDCDDGC